MEQKDTKRKFESLVYALLGSAAIICLLLSNVLRFYAQDWFTSLLHELGFAAIVALILTFTIERFSRERHAAEVKELTAGINRDLFHAVYGRHLPPGVFTEVERLLLAQRAHRSKLHVEYEFFDRPGRSTFVCKLRVSYELFNPSSEPVRCSVGMFVESPSDGRDTELCQVTDVTLGKQKLARVEIDGVTTKGRFAVVFDKDVELGAGERLEVDIHGQLVKNVIDTELWTSQMPCDGLRLTVRMPPGMNFEARSIHSQPLRELHSEQTMKVWRIDGGLIPQQGIAFWWANS